MSADFSLGPRLDPDALVLINNLAVVDHVIGGVAHSLNNALQAVSGMAELLGARTDLPPQVKDRAGRIATQASEAARLVRDFSWFGKLQPPAVERVEVRGAFESALARRRYNLGRAHVETSIEATGGACLVLADRRELDLVATNLILNAEQAMEGRENGRLVVTIVRAGGFVRATVVDNGVGMAPGIRDRIFEPFFTTRPGPPLRGVGLTVARMLTERRGGRLTLADPPGAAGEAGPGGARFVLEMPVTEVGGR